jgi:hypothetical protein
MNKITLIILPALLCLSSFTSFSQPVSFASGGIGGGRSLLFPIINPANDNEFYVSCDMSELFHSIDFGNTY